MLGVSSGTMETGRGNAAIDRWRGNPTGKKVFFRGKHVQRHRLDFGGVFRERVLPHYSSRATASVAEQPAAMEIIAFQP